MTKVVNLSNNDDIDGILWGWAWGTGGPQNSNFFFPYWHGRVRLSGNR